MLFRSDRDFVLQMVPNMAITQAGNLARIQVIRRINDRAIVIAQMAREYEATNRRIDGGFRTMLAEFGEANPVFPDMIEAAGTATPGNYIWTPENGLVPAP